MTEMIENINKETIDLITKAKEHMVRIKGRIELIELTRVFNQNLMIHNKNILVEIKKLKITSLSDLINDKL